MVETVDVLSGPNKQGRATLAEVATPLHATGQRHGVTMTRLAAALATKKG